MNLFERIFIMYKKVRREIFRGKSINTTKYQQYVITIFSYK